MNFSSFAGAIALIIAIYILWQIRFIILLTFASVALATAINYLVKYLMRLGVKKRNTAILLSLMLLLLIFVCFILLIFPPFIDQVQRSLYLLPEAVDQIAAWLTWLQARVPKQLVGEIQKLENITRNLPTFATQLLGNFYGIFSGSLGAVVNILLVGVVTIMLLITPHPYLRLFLAFFPSFYRRRAAKIIKKCEQALGGWTQGILFNMFVISILSWLGLSILGVQLPLANALLAGLLTFIPNLGAVLSCIPPIILALIDAPWKALAVLLLYFLIQQAETNVLTPLVMKQQVSLLPAVTLLAQATFAIFFGFIGLFLALPLTVVSQVWIEEVLIKDILSNWGKKSDRSRSKQASTSQTKISKSSSPKVITSEIGGIGGAS
ncbi:AI-2E family transporter [Pleurocapsa sp. CCALA 161]|uniref:AI-2E family transporter n=1 Tax=Pleurocapsa sp. CCALA 161 TaxID=2107688 RepID=UPI000D04B648|nr:AI-2E family transporter [Pleurocapsa sp. CCALA 161]PSB07234.1 AI-2E family transporter [Pleurocapsa sp. CCALA 161]